MASNALGRVLLNASRLKRILPEHHAELQDSMPLTPDRITFRTLMCYHAKTSGNLDRLTVLLDEMTRQFQIPMTHLTFQFLFKGFAMHGGSEGSTATWTRQRLGIAWAACLACMKAGMDKNGNIRREETGMALPVVKDAEAMAAKEEAVADEQASKRRPVRKPSAWDSFIKQFTAPLPETKPFDLYSTSVDAREPNAEDDERASGEGYRLPVVDLRPQSSAAGEAGDLDAVQPTKHLVLWAIRAFTRCTASRNTLEDVWHQFSQLWRPLSGEDRMVAIRELRRALRYCDTHGGR